MNATRSWHCDFLARLSPRVQGKVLELAQVTRFAPGETIFCEGQAGAYLYVVKSGQVSIEFSVPANGVRTLLNMACGDVFGWSALVGPRVETASARAGEETEVLQFEGSALEQLCEADPEVGFQVYRVLTEVIKARLYATRFQLAELTTGK